MMAPRCLRCAKRSSSRPLMKSRMLLPGSSQSLYVNNSTEGGDAEGIGLLQVNQHAVVVVGCGDLDRAEFSQFLGNIVVHPQDRPTFASLEEEIVSPRVCVDNAACRSALHKLEVDIVGVVAVRDENVKTSASSRHRKTAG